MMQAFTDQLEMPSLVVSHMYEPQYISRLMEHGTRDSLLIYVHREETSRLLSAIRFVITDRYCSPKGRLSTHPGVAVVNNTCTVQEKALIEIIQNQKGEIGFGGPRLWMCETFESLKDNFPNLVFIHYKQASKLVPLLSKHHCPSMMKKEFHHNVASEKEMASFVLKNDDNLVELDNWLLAKEQLLEYFLGMKHGVDKEHKTDISCQRTMRKIENKLFACPSETLQLSGMTYGSRSIDFEF